MQSLLYPIYYGAEINHLQKASVLRKNMTEAEKVLWTRLRNNKVMNLKFRRQHPVKQFILDFYNHDYKLAIEIDGEIHNQPSQKERDSERTQIFQELGIEEIRFTNQEVIKNTDFVVDEIVNQIKIRKAQQIQ